MSLHPLDPQARTPEEQPVITDPTARAVEILSTVLGDEATARAALAALESASLHVIATEPSEGLLVSMALRLDHGMLQPQLRFDAKPGASLSDAMETPEQMRRRIEVKLSDMRKAYEEIAGQGFHSPAREPMYVEMRKRGVDTLTLFQISRASRDEKEPTQ